ncbi:unnamed protein product [Urochloa humidicola]
MASFDLNELPVENGNGLFDLNLALEEGEGAPLLDDDVRVLEDGDDDAPVLEDVDDDAVLEEDADDAPVLEDGDDDAVLEEVADDVDLNVFDLNLPLDEFGAVDFDFVHNNLGK